MLSGSLRFITVAESADGTTLRLFSVPASASRAGKKKDSSRGIIAARGLSLQHHGREALRPSIAHRPRASIVATHFFWVSAADSLRLRCAFPRGPPYSIRHLSMFPIHHDTAQPQGGTGASLKAELMKTRTKGTEFKLDRRLFSLLKMIERHMAAEVLPNQEVGEWLGDFVEKLVRHRRAGYTIAELKWAVDAAETRRYRTRPKPPAGTVIVPFPAQLSRKASL